MFDMTDDELLKELKDTESTLRSISRQQDETQDGAKYDWLQESGEYYQKAIRILVCTSTKDEI